MWSTVVVCRSGRQQIRMDAPHETESPVDGFALREEEEIT
jgi:hypothetical protein